MPPVLCRTAPHASAAHLSLDIPEKQILIRYAADQYLWHHRALLIRISGSKWIVATPTLAVEQTDLATEQFQPLIRGAAFPLEERPFFTFGDLTAGDLDVIRSRAAALAEILHSTRF